MMKKNSFFPFLNFSDLFFHGVTTMQLVKPSEANNHWDFGLYINLIVLGINNKSYDSFIIIFMPY